MTEKFQRTLTLGLLSSLAVLLTACTLPNLTELKEKATGLIKKETQETAQTTETEEESPFVSVEDKDSGRLTSILSSGETLECTFEQITALGEAKSTLYTDGTNVLITSEVAETPEVKTYMLLKGKQYYVWNEPDNKGVKMSMEETPDHPDQNTAEPFENLEDTPFICSPGKFSTSIFEIPSGVEFFEPQGILNPEAIPNFQ